MSHPTIKPCPDCEGPARFITVLQREYDYGYVRCDQCGFKSPQIEREAAIADWNERDGE